MPTPLLNTLRAFLKKIQLHRQYKIYVRFFSRATYCKLALYCFMSTLIMHRKVFLKLKRQKTTKKQKVQKEEERRVSDEKLKLNQAVVSVFTGRASET